MDLKSRACNCQLADTPIRLPPPVSYRDLVSAKDNTPQTNPLYIKPKRQRPKRIKLEVFVKKSLPKLLLRYQKYLDAKI